MAAMYRVEQRIEKDGKRLFSPGVVGRKEDFGEQFNELLASGAIKVAPPADPIGGPEKRYTQAEVDEIVAKAVAEALAKQGAAISASAAPLKRGPGRPRKTE